MDCHGPAGLAMTGVGRIAASHGDFIASLLATKSPSWDDGVNYSLCEFRNKTLEFSQCIGRLMGAIAQGFIECFDGCNFFRAVG